MNSPNETYDDKCWSSSECTDKSKEQQRTISAYSRQDNNLVWHEMRQTEQLLASEFSRLSVEEQSEALHDIHCVGEELKENPEMVENLLRQFDQTVRQTHNPIYAMAVNQNKEYVEDSSFRLKFLRCNMYDVHQSVCQMMNFLENKATCFGQDKVSREITLHDLGDDAKELLLSGLYHIQKDRDQTGRVVLYMMSDMFGRCNIETMVSTFAALFAEEVWCSLKLTKSIFCIPHAIDPCCVLHIQQNLDSSS